MINVVLKRSTARSRLEVIVLGDDHMDNDIERQQQEAERVAAGLAPREPVNCVSAATLEPQSAVLDEEASVATAHTPEIQPEIEDAPEPPAATAYSPETEPLEVLPEAPAAAAPLPGEIPAAPAKKAGNPNRRALPPIGTGRRPGEAPPKRRRLRGFLRLLVFVIVGAIIGSGVGYAAMTYLHVPFDQEKLYLYGSVGGLALIFGFIGLLHFDHH